MMSNMDGIGQRHMTTIGTYPAYTNRRRRKTHPDLCTVRREEIAIVPRPENAVRLCEDRTIGLVPRGALQRVAPVVVHQAERIVGRPARGGGEGEPDFTVVVQRLLSSGFFFVVFCQPSFDVPLCFLKSRKRGGRGGNTNARLTYMGCFIDGRHSGGGHRVRSIGLPLLRTTGDL